MMKKEIKKKIRELKPTVRIGKQGLTEEIIKQIKQQLKKNKVVKVKMLKTYREDKDKKKLAEEIARKTGSELINLTGFVATLHKNRNLYK